MSTFFMPVRAWSLPSAAAESAINATLTGKAQRAHRLDVADHRHRWWRGRADTGVGSDSRRNPGVGDWRCGRCTARVSGVRGHHDPRAPPADAVRLDAE